MNAGALNGRRELREPSGLERYRPLESERIRGLLRRQECQRDRGDEVLLASKARPERGVDQRLDRLGIRRRRDARLAALLRVGDMPDKMLIDPRGDGPSRRIRRSGHWWRERRGRLVPPRLP